MWEEIVEGIKEFFNQPITIIVSSLTSATVGILTIISKTSFGRKSIAWLKERISHAIEQVEKNEVKVVEAIDFTRAKTDELKNHYEAKLNELYNQLDLFQKGMVAIIEQIPNIKVQEKLKEFVDQYENAKGDIIEFSKITFAEANDLIEQARHESDSQIALLLEKINKLEELVQPLLNVAESGENEQENEE